MLTLSHAADLRQRATEDGPSSLGDAELLALLLGVNPDLLT